MTRRFIDLSLIVVGFTLGSLAGSAPLAQQPPPSPAPQAQAPPAPVAIADPAALPAASPEALKDVGEWLNVVRIAQQFASAQCDQLASVRQLVQLRAAYTKKVRDRLRASDGSTYEPNWSTYTLVAVPAEAK